MCYYRLFIFLGCGHSTFSSTPVRYCANAKIKGTAGQQQRAPRFTSRSPCHSATSSSESNVYSRPEFSNTATLSNISSPCHTTDSMVEPPNEINTRGETVTRGDDQACSIGHVHPLHTIRLEHLCAICDWEREERLRALESSTSEIRFEPWRWQCKYRGSNTVPHIRKHDKSKGEVHDGRASVVWGVGATVGGWWKRKDSGIAEEE
ncbi:hypothetical protein BKA66DRAFT_451676 [Pyrenochaeta sp. MPI-SDFR-AT-0127]|nr:hypothetical protein BKA66DRAFT_451676 [Pyrenochaeta sp. MPI-SDFR-AT-0127]